MKLKIYQVDAFTDKLFGGNPAAVVPLEKWFDNELLQKIAAENNLAETAYYIKEGKDFRIRWFTPGVEVRLCGHATLATAWVLFNKEGYRRNEVKFNSRSGMLSVKKTGNLLTLNFPTDTINPVEVSKEFIAAIGKNPVESYKGKDDYLLIYETEAEIKSIAPDFRALLSIPDCRGVIVSAKGDEVDFVSRFFAPAAGIDEDPVTGSAHTTLTPYWSKQLNKAELSAKQISNRVGDLNCKLKGDRVEISGNCVLYLKGEIEV